MNIMARRKVLDGHSKGNRKLTKAQEYDRRMHEKYGPPLDTKGDGNWTGIIMLGIGVVLLLAVFYYFSTILH